MKKIFDLFKKPLESVSDEITTKFKTPFFSIYIVIWMIRNNIFIYNLFFNTSIADKTITLNNQFNIEEGDFYLQTFYSIVITLGLLIVYYIIINISRTITIISEERVKLNLLEFFQSKTIRYKDDVDFLTKKVDEFKQKNKELESELTIVRDSNDHVKGQLKRADDEMDKIIKQGKINIDNIKTLLNNKLYIIKDTPQGVSLSKIATLKETLEKEFAGFDDLLKPKKPSFLSI